MNILDDLRWRGLIADTNLDSEAPTTVYAGFDPTADSLHVGHLMALTILRRFQQAGHRPIALIGGATGMIGDPSGKSEERNLLSSERVTRNVIELKKQLHQCLGDGAIIVNNHEWMRDFNYLDFLRDVGKHFPVNVMLSKDSVKSRMESGLSYTEFSYMLVQAYDFVHLSDCYGCTLQIGGSDQWGNITAGIELGRRMRAEQLYGLTCPLLTRSDGTKMGKTESGTVWLSDEKTSPYEFYQFWMNIDDSEVCRFLNHFSDLSQEGIATIIAEHQERPEKRIAQRRLAEELTRLIHGPESC